MVASPDGWMTPLCQLEYPLIWGRCYLHAKEGGLLCGGTTITGLPPVGGLPGTISAFLERVFMHMLFTLLYECSV